MPAPALTTSTFARRRAADPPSLAWILLLALALFALALPIVGPLDDHHFAERSHTHLHIYLDGRPVSHGHAEATTLPHQHLGRPNPLPNVGRESLSRDVVYLADATASLLLAVMNAPYHSAPEALRPATPRDKNANPLGPFTRRYQKPTGHSVSPPLPPPIA